MIETVKPYSQDVHANLAKVAVVSSIPLFPIIGGNRARIHELCRALRELGCDVRFIYLPLRRQPIDEDAHVNFFGDGNYCRLHNGGVVGSVCQWIRGELSSKLRNGLQRYFGFRGWYYSNLDASYNPAWSGQIRRLAKGVDVALVEYVFNTRALGEFPDSTLRILDTHDSFADRHIRYARQGLRSGYWISLRAEDEVEGLLRADRILAIQEGEAEIFRKQIAEKVGQVEQSKVVTISHFPPINRLLRDYSKNNVAAFVGSDNPANRQAVTNFVLNILPFVRGRVPDFRFIVAGRISDFAKSFDNVDCIGFVNEVGGVYEEAPLSLNPMLSGTGVAIKLLDAMSYGVPSITTATGARGVPLPYLAGVIVVADDDCAGFADAVVRACSDGGLRKEMGMVCHEAAKAWRSSQLSLLQECLTSG